MSRRVYYKSLQLEQIRSFCRVARLGSFAAGAAELGLSAPTVWRQVRAFERECRAVLLVRKGRAIQLTAEGRLALDLLEPHLSGIDSVRELLQQQIATLPRQLAVASTSMLLTSYLPKPLSRFIDAEPAVTLSVLNEPADRSLRLVADGEADIGVVTYLPDDPPEGRVLYEDLFELPWLLATAKGHPLSRKRNLRLADLLDWPWIMPAQETQPRRHVDAVLRREGLHGRVRIILESRNFSLTHQYVKMGLGISVWYGSDPNRSTDDVWARPVPHWFGIAPVAAISRKGRHQPPQVEAFLQVIRETLGRPPR